VIRLSDAEYEAARKVHNAAIDRRPALIVRCADAGDVTKCVNFAREEGLLPAVRCGGHSFPGLSTCDGGILIDLSAMKSIHIDPERRVARVGGGCTWSDFDQAAHADEFSHPGQGLLLNPGEYTVKVVKVGARDGAEEKVRLDANQVAVVRMK